MVYSCILHILAQKETRTQNLIYRGQQIHSILSPLDEQAFCRGWECLELRCSNSRLISLRTLFCEFFVFTKATPKRASCGLQERIGTDIQGDGAFLYMVKVVDLLGNGIGHQPEGGGNNTTDQMVRKTDWR